MLVPGQVGKTGLMRDFRRASPEDCDVICIEGGDGQAELDGLRQRGSRTFATVREELEADGYLVREWWRKRHVSRGAA